MGRNGTMDEINNNDSVCDSSNNASSPSASDVIGDCQLVFLKCNPKDRPPAEEEESPPLDGVVNTHNVLKRTAHKAGAAEASSRLFAKQVHEDDGSWLLRWDVPVQHDGDFIALCYSGEVAIFCLQFYFYLCKIVI